MPAKRDVRPHLVYLLAPVDEGVFYRDPSFAVSFCGAHAGLEVRIGINLFSVFGRDRPLVPVGAHEYSVVGTHAPMKLNKELF